MAKDINIHLKTHGAERTKQQLNDVGRSAQKTGGGVQDMGKKTESASGSMLGNLRKLSGLLGFAGFASLAVAAIRRIITAIDDMKKAVNEAVQALSEQQKAAADFFEAFEAYTPQARREALFQAREFQAKTGIPFEASKAILESYKRTFGQINQQAVEQFAGYWQLHAQEATSDLIRWMGAEGVADPFRQGQIMRMISTMATQTGLRDPEIIQGILRYSTEFRQMGWSPEETIKNVGKVMAGLAPREARRAMSGLVEGLKAFTEEKAVEAGAPPEVAEDESRRLEWVREQIEKMDQQARNRFMREMFGQTYAAYVTKFLTGRMLPETARELEYARTPQAAVKEQERVESVRRTAEGILQKTEGGTERFNLLIEEEEKLNASIRRHGEAYLNYLRRRNRIQYEKIKALGLSEELEKELAAKELFYTIHEREWIYSPHRGFGPRPRTRTGERLWRETSLFEKLEELRKAQYKIEQSELDRIFGKQKTVEKTKSESSATKFKEKSLITPISKEIEVNVPIVAVAEKQQVGVPVEITADKQQIGIPVEVAADKQQVDVPVEVAADKQQVGIPVEVTADEQQVGVPVEIEAVADKQQIGVPVEVAAEKQQVGVPVEVTADNQQVAVPVEAVSEKQQVGVPVEAVAGKQKVDVPVEVAADMPQIDIPVQPVRERFEEKVSTSVVYNHFYYDYGMRFFPRAGEDESGPRIEPGAFG